MRPRIYDFCTLFVGDIFILVIVKVMQYNMAHTKDQYLQTNCLATLANASSKFSQLHSFVCQKLVSFYSALVKRYNKTIEKLQLSAMKSHDEDPETESLNTLLTQVS